MKRRWLIVSAVVGLLAVAIVGAGIVAAQSSDGDSAVSAFSARVAAILGLDEQTVDDAITQARKELKEERLQERLDEKVAAGAITQEQADEYMAWIQSKPEGFHEGRFGKGDHGKGHRHGKGDRDKGRHKW